MPGRMVPALLLLAACQGEGPITAPSGPAVPEASPNTALQPRPPSLPPHVQRHRDCEGTTTLDSMNAVVRGRATQCHKDIYLQLLMERGRSVGPWIEDLYVLRTRDGIVMDTSEAIMVRSSGAVPEVIEHDGRVWMFYGEGDLGKAFGLADQDSAWFTTHGLLGFGALDLMVSDDGIHFEPVPEFVIEGLVLGMVVDPDVIRLPDGRFRLYYVGLTIEEVEDPTAWDDDAQHRVYYAESDDLIHWKQVGVAVHGPIADPSVLCIDEHRCRMFSTGLDHSHSSDGGRNFVFDGATKVRGFAPEFLAIDGQLRQYYNAMIYGGPLMVRASADNGKTWSEPEEVVPAYQAEAPSFVRDPSGDGWLMYFHYYMEEYRDIYPARPNEDEVVEEPDEDREPTRERRPPLENQR